MQIYSQYEKRLIDLLDLNIEKVNDNYAIITEKSNRQKVGFLEKVIDNKGEIYSNLQIKLPNFIYDGKRNIKEDNLDTYEFLVKGDNQKLVTTYLSLGDTVKLGFMDDKEGVRSLTISNNTLDLTFSSSTSDKRICEQVIVKSDDKRDIKRYFGTNYSYQLSESSLKKTDSNEVIKTASLNFEANPENVYEVILTMKYFKDNSKEVIHLKKGTTIREAILKDAFGLEAFNRFRFYANRVLPFKKDIMEVFLNGKELKDDVLGLFYKELVGGKPIGEKSFVIALTDDILFSLTMDSNKDLEKARVHGRLIKNLKDIYPFGYVESDNGGEFIFDDSTYIFKLNSNGEIERVFDYINFIEIFDLDTKMRIYEEYQDQKKLEK